MLETHISCTQVVTGFQADDCDHGRFVRVLMHDDNCIIMCACGIIL